jgi:hypothetical protein
MKLRDRAFVLSEKRRINRLGESLSEPTWCEASSKRSNAVRFPSLQRLALSACWGHAALFDSPCLLSLSL